MLLFLRSTLVSFLPSIQFGVNILSIYLLFKEKKIQISRNVLISLPVVFLMKVALVVSGSVGAVKAPLLVRSLEAIGHECRVAVTASAERFLCPGGAAEAYDEAYSAGSFDIVRDADEWAYDRVGDPVVHVELAKWADLLLIAPASKNTIAKAALGLCDNLATCIIAAWRPSKPIIIAPAMNTFMWEAATTQEHIGILERRGALVVPPASSSRAATSASARLPTR